MCIERRKEKRNVRMYMCVGASKKKKWGCKHHILCLFFFFYVVVVGAISFFFSVCLSVCVSVCLYPLQLNKLVKYVEDLQESHSDRRGGQKNNNNNNTKIMIRQPHCTRTDAGRIRKENPTKKNESVKAAGSRGVERERDRRRSKESKKKTKRNTKRSRAT